MTVVTLEEGQRVLDEDGFSDISVAAEGGTTPEELKAAISAELGDGYAVRTGEEQAEKAAQDLSSALGFIRIALLVFAGVAVLVGGFLIFNTFAVTVAQRSREFALLRTLGASRPQILRSVMVESLVIGLVASIIGIAAGLIVAPALRSLFSAFNLDLGSTSMPLEPRTIIISLLVGVIATVVSGFVPARRATRVQPVEAMRDADTPGPPRLRKRRIAVALLVEAAGVALLLYGLLGDPGTAAATAYVLGFGTLLMIFGLALLAPTLVRPLSSAIGRPLERVLGLAGRLARENSTRQPQRTAITASALMIGVALVVLVAIFAAGLRATIDQGIDEQVRAAGIITHDDGFSPLPVGVTEAVEQVDGVTAVSALRFESGRIVGETGNTGVTGVDDATVRDVLTLNWDEGSDDVLSNLGSDRAAISNEFAESNDLAVGDSLSFLTPRGNEVSYTVNGIYDSTAGFVGGVVVEQLFARERVGRRRHRVRARRRRAGCRSRGDQGRRGERAGGLPDRQADDDRGLQGRAEQAGRHARLSRAGTARPVGDRRPARNGQHDGPDRARAAARARDAARGRHVAPSGAADGARRVGDHRADRGRSGHAAGHRVRGAVVTAAGRRGLRLRAPVGLADRRRDPGRDRGRAGGDPARPPGLARGCAESSDNRVGG